MKNGIKHDSGHFYREFQASLNQGNWVQQVHKPKESKWVQAVDLHVAVNLKKSKLSITKMKFFCNFGNFELAIRRFETKQRYTTSERKQTQRLEK